MNTAYVPYAPLNTLKPIATDVWIADGPEIRFRYGMLRIPFPTRMTVVRLPSGGLWIHSPIEDAECLIEEVRGLGPVEHLVAPNNIHYWWLDPWKRRFPEATVWAVPELRHTAKRAIPAFRDLGDSPPPEWSDSIGQVRFSGTQVTEVDFHHRPSRTLIVADMIENFEAGRFRSTFYRWLSRLGGVLDPDGSAPRDLRVTFRKTRKEVGLAARQMIAWQPERVVIAHGRCYMADATNELKRAFRWAL